MKRSARLFVLPVLVLATLLILGSDFGTRDASEVSAPLVGIGRCEALASGRGHVYNGGTMQCEDGPGSCDAGF